ncbi:MAG: NAD(P)/FAD-dependent oxidoreductase [Calditrichaeota bacterium]|nr:NAD(P)/FAD-dependent oxidoreductase [Calditrichota bacterium]
MINNGNAVAIIGGGPGGVGCAIALQNKSRQMGRKIRVRLYEAKSQDGIPRYNQCVGVLSPPIEDILRALGVEFPHHLLQRTIEGYVLHSGKQSIVLNDESEPSLAVRRISFDHYMLDQARKHGIEVVESRVTGLEIYDDSVMLYSESDNIRASVVVGAFGLDDGSALMFSRETPYKQPKFLNSIVTKWHPKTNFIHKFDNNIHAFLPPTKKIEFGAVTPKENHFTINVAGEKVDATVMDEFLAYPPLVKLFPQSFLQERKTLSYFKGKFPISIAKGMFGDRYITVGDAAGLVRPFKGKGINSALLSGMYAASVILQNGVSNTSFKEYLKLNNEIIADLPYGKAIRIFANFIANANLLDYVLRLSRENASLQRALFNSVSAHKPYRTIVRETLSWENILAGVKSFFE